MHRGLERIGMSRRGGAVIVPARWLRPVGGARTT
jgi:hypothetical protein